MAPVKEEPKEEDDGFDDTGMENLDLADVPQEIKQELPVVPEGSEEPPDMAPPAYNPPDGNQLTSYNPKTKQVGLIASKEEFDELLLYWWHDVAGGDPAKFHAKMKTLFTAKKKPYRLDREYMVRRARKIRDMMN